MDKNFTPAQVDFFDSVRRFAKRIGYKKPIMPDDVRAVRRVQIIQSLGFDVTPAHIEREIKISQSARAMREAQEMEQ